MAVVTEMSAFLSVVLILNAVDVSAIPDCNCIGFGDFTPQNGS